MATYGSRRVPGLRREEVAVLAGVSIQYYTRLERGDMSGAFESVLEALARALQLDDAEPPTSSTSLAPHTPPRAAASRQTKQRLRPEVQWTLDAITGAAAFVSNERLDILASNQLGRSAVLRAVRRLRAPGQHRPLPLPRSARRGGLRRLGPRRNRDRRHPALGRRPRPLRPRPHRPRRRARADGFTGPAHLTDAVAVAGTQAQASGDRTAVVLVLDESQMDPSQYAPAQARGYLARLRIPLFVWTIAPGKPVPLAAGWGPVVDISRAANLRRAVKELRDELESQRVVWIEGTEIPDRIEVTEGEAKVPENGVRPIP